MIEKINIVILLCNTKEQEKMIKTSLKSQEHTSKSKKNKNNLQRAMSLGVNSARPTVPKSAFETMNSMKP